MKIRMMRSTAVAALLALPLSAGVAFAQQSDGAGQVRQPADQAQGQEGDALLATVGDAEIRGSDVMTLIGTLPQQMQAQPAQMLVPAALEHLILRELVLEEARSENLAEDPEVIALVEGAASGAEEDAMVQVWIERELAGAVTDAEVERIYGTLQPQGNQAVPPMSELRPQIEQQLRQQAMQAIGNMLRQDATVVFYDPSGQPIQQDETQAGQDTESGAEIEGTQSTAGESGMDDGASTGETDGSTGETADD